MLSVQGVSKTFGGLTAVANFQLELPTGGLQALIGPNGAGKTTCFNLLTGIYRPDTGNIVLDGQTLVGKKPYAIAACGMSRTFQNIRLFKELSVIDNVKVGCHLRASESMLSAILRTPKAVSAEREMTQRAGRLLEIFGLSAVANAPAASLPYGDQRRLEIARAIATEPKVLLLDEPVAGMNSHEKVALRDRHRFHPQGLRSRACCSSSTTWASSCRPASASPSSITASSLLQASPTRCNAIPKVIEAYLGGA